MTGAGKVSASRLLLLLLAIVAVCGGGGSPAVIAEGVAVVGALALAAVAIATGVRLVPSASVAVTCLALSLPVLALVQLVPLPASWWQALPGRSPLMAGLESAGAGSAAWPLSIVPSRTLAAFLSLAPPLVAFSLTTTLDKGARTGVLVALVVLGAATAFVAFLQAVGGDSFYLYARSILAFPSGLFANHNAQGDCLLIALAAATALWFDGKAVHRIALTGAITLLAVALLLSGSRAAIVLVIVPIALAIVLATRGGAPANWTVRIAPVAAAAVLTGVLLIASDNPWIGNVLGRFGADSDPRLTRLWPDSWYTMKTLFPFGSGLGTFPQAFEQFERLEIVAPGLPNRAHMDYVEFVIEAGLASVAILSGAAIVLARRMFSWTGAAYHRDRATAVGWAIIAVGVLHSLVDYPLRAITLSVLFAIGCGLVFARHPENAA